MNSHRRNLCLLAISVAAVGGVLFFACTRPKSEPPIDNSLFGKVKLGMGKYEVHQLLKGRSESINPPGWPRTLGEIPGWDRQIGGWRLEDSTIIDWYLWRVDDQHKWIAVGFVDDECCGTFGPLIAAIKKSGLRDNLNLGG